MDPVILNRGLKLINKIYDGSIGLDTENDLFRIKDIINSLDENHWKGKQWLVDELSDYVFKDNPSVLVDAGWYGLTGYLFKKEFPDSKVLCSDIDPITRKYGKYLFKKIEFKISNALVGKKSCDVYVNTSIEHIEKKYVNMLLDCKIKKGTIVALQSNNYFDHPTHINCSPDLDDFVSYTKKHLNILYSGELDLGDFTRYMVIGIK